MKKRIISLLSCLSAIYNIAAQTQPANEFGIWLGGGSHSLKYSIEQGGVKSGFGGGLGLGYSRFFSRYIGVSLGLEADLYGSSLSINNLHTEYQIQTPPGLSGNFWLYADNQRIEEKQRAVFLQLPVMLQLQAPLGSASFFYIGAGAKVGFTASKTWSQTIGTLTTTGFSDYTNQTYTNMPNHGFETKNGSQASGSLTLGSPVMMALEGGFKWIVSDIKLLYTGIYIDYGLTDLYKPESKNLLEYNSSSPANYGRNSILQTALTNSSQGIKTFAIGLKIRLSFGSGTMLEGKKSIPPPLLARMY